MKKMRVLPAAMAFALALAGGIGMPQQLSRAEARANERIHRGQQDPCPVVSERRSATHQPSAIRSISPAPLPVKRARSWPSRAVLAGNVIVLFYLIGSLTAF